jgi:hypothetical protein
MMNILARTRRLIKGSSFAFLFLSFLMAGMFASFSYVHAQDIEQTTAGAESKAAAAEGACLTSGPVPSTCPPRGIKENLAVVGDKIVSPTFRVALIQALLNLSQFVLDRLAYEAAVAISSGGAGEGSLFYEQTPAEAFGQLGLEVAGEAVGMLSDLNASELGIEFDLCDPGDALSLALAIGIKQKYQPTAPKCDIMEVIDNWQAFGANIANTITDPEARQDAILSKFAESLRPGRNELTASLRLNIAIDQKVHEQKLLQFLQRNEDDFRSVTDFITGNVKTPSSILEADFQSRLKEQNGDDSKIRVNDLIGSGELIGQLAITTASTFTNTLLSQTFARIYDGLFEPEPLPDPFNIEGLGGGDRESAEERFASIISPSPIATSDYNALSEFVVCIAEGVINRGLNNCVMDVNFLAAVSRGSNGASGAAMTVQEAIDEGLLNGDWPLIPPSDRAANQDSFCYTYGYCYGNIVKLRNARVLPIGWELAALRNTGSTRASLQDVVDAFDDCTENGTIGPSNAANDDTRWCHLIDPNWVLKYPDTQCRALTTGEIRISQLSPGRTSSCVDSPSCIGENNDGVCTDGYGYCVREKNVWRFRGDECPEEYASCLSFTNTESDDSADYIVNTVEYSVCDEDNAGCFWYRTNKSFEDAGTSDVDDDSYEWLPDGETYTTSEREDDWSYQDSTGAAVSRASYSYTSDSGEVYSNESYSFEDRVYLTHSASTCAEGDKGCTQLLDFDDDLYLNHVQNPSFENDENSDDIPDSWIEVGGTYSINTTYSVFGDSSIEMSPSSTLQLEQYIDVVENNFYTFSAYVRADVDGDRNNVRLIFYDEDGGTVDAAGTSFGGDCTWSSFAQLYDISSNPSADEFERIECTFTTPEDTIQVRLLLGAGGSSGGTTYIDAVQLEIGDDANGYVEGYSIVATESYYQVAPDYLGCTGASSDPEGCDDYAQVCSAQDVGCNLYTPEDGDPSVPAIISELDICPSECVGYTTYKQEATDYDSEDFPLYFIASSATVCSEQYVGCDAFTNLDDLDAGGEDVEYYTELRSCLSEDIIDDSVTTKTAATFFTWEGSDTDGYQLQTWSLLQSNYSGVSTFTGAAESSGFVETSPELAPCTHISMASEDEVVCNDTTADMANDVWINVDCDDHDDIFDNPDCREFFDSEGNIHYREYSSTVSISNECTPYRKDESNSADCGESGGYWTSQGFCRYYVLPDESNSCPSEQNGCREYTGGTGRNATTIVSETFEAGTYEEYVLLEPTTGSSSTILSISNESVATDGHSLYALADGSDSSGFETVQIYLDSSDPTSTYDEDDSSTCTGTEVSTGCEVENDVDLDGNPDETCVIADGEASCGTLTDSLVAGKTFVLDFWAKGSSDLYVTFAEDGGTGTQYDMVDAPTVVTSVDGGTALELDGSWRLYSLGPFDTSSLEDFDENAVLRFATITKKEFYIDNIVLKQVEENVTVIKDSWVVPSTCDQTPAEVDSDQYYLGCEAYSDQNGSDVELYQFSDVCSEEVIGCEGFYDTSDSESVYQQVFNARCAFDSDGDITTEETVDSILDCEIDGVEYCTILVGQSFCTFDAEQVFQEPLPTEALGSTAQLSIIYGPETRVVRADRPVYIVASSDFECASTAMGCEEFGKPTFSQDQSEVESFESVYMIDLPADYDSILCNNEALFCEEWRSTEDDLYYFKDPLDKTCEFKGGVTINNRSYSGWFRVDTSEPCDWTDTDSNGSFDPTIDDSYLISGIEFGVWKNGDDAYDQWIAQCETKYDLCTEFIDTVDTEGGVSEDGTSYYFTNNDLLDESNLTDTQRCNSQVSQKFGCALFNNTTNSDSNYNAGASYVLSIHADVFYGTTQNDLVDPISCDTEDGGLFDISEASALIAGIYDEAGDLATEVNLCERRCKYTPESGDSLTTLEATNYGSSGAIGDDRWFERSCFIDSDCPVLNSYLGEELEGTCEDVNLETYYPSTTNTSDYYLEDDTNEILKVNRDRSCSAWLACESSRTSWNTLTNKYDSVCDSINLCVDGSTQGDNVQCDEWSDDSVEILTAYNYSARDVTWTGYEYSGNAIPNQLPTQALDQFNIEAQSFCDAPFGAGPILNDLGLPTACVDGLVDCGTSGAVCTTDEECTTDGYGGCDGGTCFYECDSSTSTDYRLVYNAGPCDSLESGDGNGGRCLVGHCEDSGNSCGDSADCSSSEQCLVGYCQATGDTDCADDSCSCNPDNNDTDGTNTACSTATSGALVDTPFCDPVQFVCVSDLPGAGDACASSVDCGSGSTALEYACVPVSDSTVGACFNNRCLSEIADGNGDGFADALTVDTARESSCRGYPEINSPFSEEVVASWLTYDGTNVTDNGDEPSGISPGFGSTAKRSIPYTYVNGFNDATVCSFDDDGELVDCSCSYDKAEYGGGSDYRYFHTGTGITGAYDGICSGGPVSGIPCLDDDDCTEGERSGTCSLVSRVDSLYGWSGYCIERDSSIQTLGKATDEYQACLSWLPVDQLSGATDLYAKYINAGYAPQNTYYCAEVELTYDIMTSGIACAEVQDNHCNDNDWDDFKDDFNSYREEDGKDDDCIAGVWCPEAYFAVMTGCGDVGWNNRCEASSSDNDKDCPYFCVPKLSYKTSSGDEGEACTPPDSYTYKVWLPDAVDHWAHNFGSYTDAVPRIWVYLLGSSSFGEAVGHYNDCTVKGVIGSVNEYAQKFDGSGNTFADVYSAAGTSSYRSLDMNYTGYAACTSVVQVSQQSLDANSNETYLPFVTYNAAQTNRLWEDHSVGDEFEISDGASSTLSYELDTEFVPFGASIDYLVKEATEVDPYPFKLAMCSFDSGRQVVPEVELSCSSSSATAPRLESYDARAFSNIRVTKNSTVDEDYCLNTPDCSCRDGSGTGIDNDKCNYDHGNAYQISCGTLTASIFSEGVGFCENDLSLTCTFTDEDEDEIDDDCVSVGGACVGNCYGGPNDGDDCGRPDDPTCEVNYCDGDPGSGGTVTSADCVLLGTASTYNLRGASSGDSIDLLSQLFGRIYRVIEYNEDYGGVADSGSMNWDETRGWFEEIAYSQIGHDEDPTDHSDWIWEARDESDAYAYGSISTPVIYSVGACEGSTCYEGDLGKFTINEIDSGIIESEGSLRASVSFFAEANPNQMPIRRIAVDWGNDFTFTDSGLPWPTGSRSGSVAPDNFYKNQRGLAEISDQEACDDTTPENFGETSRACNRGYVNFLNDYTCSQGQLNSLEDRACQFDDSGERILNSPCTLDDACVFQPRVHVMDNWGWCTGECDAGADGGSGCYTGDGQDECDIDNCPSDNDTGSGTSGLCDDIGTTDIVNPWENFDGYIVIYPE